MIGLARHLSDDRLFECYLAAQHGDDIDQRTASHLGECDACSGRYAELSALLSATRADADAETDEIFNPARLRHQREQILRRIEHADRPARVISFPGRDNRHRADTPGRIASRWLVAAAAAGLLVGAVVGGRFLGPATRNSAPPMAIGAQSASLVPAAVRINTPVVAADVVVDDDAFLEELSVALERPQTRELQPFDALTPHVQEIGTRLR